ncbi:MAG: hypothetical protein V4482_04580 [Pseudomonadota bacterium]
MGQKPIVLSKVEKCELITTARFSFGRFVVPEMVAMLLNYANECRTLLPRVDQLEAEINAAKKEKALSCAWCFLHILYHSF